jgi:uncharacterized protein YbcI
VHERQANGNGRPNAIQTAPPPEPTGAPTLEIANAMVRAYKELLGRGPTKTRVAFAGDDTLVVVLEDTITVHERTLAALGEDERLREHRLLLTTAAEHQFRSIIEGALGRRTIAHVSGFDTQRDVAMEIFTLEPGPTDDHGATSGPGRLGHLSASDRTIS